MRNKINLYWYKYSKGKGNFGDELNPYIIEKLSGAKIEYINLRYLDQDKWLAFKIIVKAFLDRNIGVFDFFNYFYYNYLSNPKILISIGSVLQFNKHKNCQVWGSGIIDNNDTINNADFKAVRGKYTQKRLADLGYLVPKVVGDPAVLLPLIYQPKILNKYTIGIIPHYTHFQDIKDSFSDDILVINLLDDIDLIINQIASCEITFSTSLHGIIVSHAYGIPSLWTEFSKTKKKLYGDNIKFRDYFSSVNLNEYNAFFVHDTKQLYDQNLKEKYQHMLLPKMHVIKSIQKDLLKVAPFKVKSQFN